jgi:hypothetical protein
MRSRLKNPSQKRAGGRPKVKALSSNPSTAKKKKRKKEKKRKWLARHQWLRPVILAVW